MMNRFSSRTGQPFSEFLTKRLAGAKAYDRIAGYFSSSILDIAGEAIDTMPDGTVVRVICNSQLEEADVATAKLAEQAQKCEWGEFAPEDLPEENHARFKKLYTLLRSGRLEVRVLPYEQFGLAHGKAGVITLQDGRKTSFLGSVNESYSGWKRNYELVWEDDSAESVNWVQAEFDSLWTNQYAIPLKDVVIEDLRRLADRTPFKDVDHWRQSDDDGGSVVAENPITRNGFGLWEHQKYFVKKAFEAHKLNGARLINADQVGLGKTCQLAMSALLMSLWDGKPVLVLLPKTLQIQWQDELINLMNIPSAAWIGGKWVDEQGQVYGNDIGDCPRRIGLVSQGLITNGSESCEKIRKELLKQDYSCVIVDECHRARRRNIQPSDNGKKPQPNNLYKYLLEISRRTRSMLLATATPVQINPIEAWDLLNILAAGNDGVLGSIGSKWRTLPEVPRVLDLITGKSDITDIYEAWAWMKNPLPETSEDPALIGRIRSCFNMEEAEPICQGTILELDGPTRQIAESALDDHYFRSFNPFVTHIVRRSRGMLEETIDPVTGLPYLAKITVELFGDDDPLLLVSYLREAYSKAEEFCQLLQKRCKAAGFFKTLLLRRIGSSMVSGYKTGKKMTQGWNLQEEDDEDEEPDNDLKNLTSEETAILKQFVDLLSIGLGNENADPKMNRIFAILDNGLRRANGTMTGPWKELGCVLFSQYLDTASWVAENLSRRYPELTVGLYAGGDSSCVYLNGIRTNKEKNEIKLAVKNGQIKLLVGTDAASEGLNLQKLATLINIDLPWNPTRLEQRKGRIQRIGQVTDHVYVYNMMYKDSVEEKVHEMLSKRLQDINDIFGQIPDVLDDVWIQVALGDKEEASHLIDSIPQTNPFQLKYRIGVDHINWEGCSSILEKKDIQRVMRAGWKQKS